MYMPFKDKVAIVTGRDRAFGFSTAKAFAEAGAAVMYNHIRRLSNACKAFIF